MRQLALWFAITIAVGCGNKSEESVCDDLCTHLIDECSLEAFPTLSSCVQGCTYNAEQGADIDGEATCIYEADCDPFAIVECEHAHGLAQ